MVHRGWLKAMSGYRVASEVFGLGVGHGLEAGASGVDLDLVIGMGQWQLG